MKFAKSKTKKSKIILFLVFWVALIIGCAVAITMSLLSRIDYILVDNPTYEVNTENTIASLFSQVNHGVIENGDIPLDTTSVGEKIQKVTFISQLGTKQVFDVVYNVVDTTAPLLTGDDELVFDVDTEIDILNHYQAEDNSGRKVELSISGEYNITEAGDYTIQIIAKDESGNESKKEVLLKITRSSSQPYPTSYYIKVNRQQNVVIVYSQDRNGDYSNIAKVFVSSTGAPDSETPLGTYTISDRYEALYLVGDVWGHYAVRISGPYFFHSVPYFSKGDPYWNDLEYLEYNKLGNGASAGCVRLAAADAKWIYDNVSYGTTVEIYDSDTLPSGVVKPPAIKIDENNPNRGWDPTDPDPDNPWN